MMLHPPSRPQHGGTLNGLRSDAFEYWRVGMADDEAAQLDFWVERAGVYQCRPQVDYSMVEYKVQRWTRVFYVVEGSAEFTFTHATRTLQQGDLLIIPPNHSCHYHVATTCRYHWFALAGQWPSVWGIPPRIQQIALGIDAGLIAIFDSLRELLIIKAAGYPLQALSSFYALLARVEQLQTPQQPTHSAYPDSVRTALIFIEENHVAKFDMAQVAEQAHVSPSHLRALFDKWVGESPKRFHTRCRIEHAQQLLQTQRLPVQTVAALVGFNDVAYFSRVFKQLTMISPRHFLKSVP